MAIDARAELADDAGRVASELVAEAEAQGWSGPDPYDGLWVGWPKVLRDGQRRRQAIIQLHAKAPVDIRRVYRRRHPRLAKAVALFGHTALVLFGRSGDAHHAAAARAALDTVVSDRAAGDRAWGYPFDTQTRWSFYARNTPNIVVTSFAGLALADGARALDASAYLERATDAARWVRDELWREREQAFAYHPTSSTVIHNASMLGASLLHRTLPDDPVAQERVGRAIAVTLRAQRPDGSWPYGEGPGLEWVDSFHTGYVLSSLIGMGATGPEVTDAIERGARYYADTFFDGAGRSMLFAGKRWPEDGHSAGTGMSTLALLAERSAHFRPVLERVVVRTLTEGMRDGRAVVRRHRWGAETVRYLRWTDAHVAYGFARAAAVLGAAVG